MTPSSQKCVGLLPAAGLGSRLAPLPCPKELLPLYLNNDCGGDALRVALVIEHSLEAMENAGMRIVYVVVSPNKPEVLRYLRNGQQWGLRLAYLVQPDPLGLAQAIDELSDVVTVSQCCTVLSLPDVVYRPLNALSIVKGELIGGNADVVLGVFPTETPEQLGPVRFRGDGVVENVYEKPQNTSLRNTWGIAAWSPRFACFLHERLHKHQHPPLTLGAVFNEACTIGLAVRSIFFEHGAYFDLGTPQGVRDFYLQEFRKERP